MGTQRRLFVAFLDVEQRVFGMGLAFSPPLFALSGWSSFYTTFWLGFLNLSSSLHYSRCCHHIGMNGRFFS
jgi:hypothetical protein